MCVWGGHRKERIVSRQDTHTQTHTHTHTHTHKMVGEEQAFPGVDGGGETTRSSVFFSRTIYLLRRREEVKVNTDLMRSYFANPWQSRLRCTHHGSKDTQKRKYDQSSVMILILSTFLLTSECFYQLIRRTLMIHSLASHMPVMEQSSLHSLL